MRFRYLGICFICLCIVSGCSGGGQEQGENSTTQRASADAPKAQQTANEKAAAEKQADDEFASEKGYAKDVLPLFIDSAKGFSQMAIAALALTIVFKEKVLGAPGPMKVSGLLIASWSCFLVTIGTAITYQWLAIRLISLKNRYEPEYFPLTHHSVWPGNIYGVMLISFFVGAILLVTTSALQLSAKTKPLPEEAS